MASWKSSMSRKLNSFISSLIVAIGAKKLLGLEYLQRAPIIPPNFPLGSSWGQTTPLPFPGIAPRSSHSYPRDRVTKLQGLKFRQGFIIGCSLVLWQHWCERLTLHKADVRRVIFPFSQMLHTVFQVAGLEWVDEEKTKLKIPWKHESRSDWTPQNAETFTVIRHFIEYNHVLLTLHQSTFHHKSILVYCRWLQIAASSCRKLFNYNYDYRHFSKYHTN